MNRQTGRAIAGELRDHVVVCGLNPLGLRTVQELLGLGERAVIVRRPTAHRFLNAARRLEVPVVAGDYVEDGVLSMAGVEMARALVLLEDDDVGNLHAALAAQELNPRLRIVVRMFNTDLGGRIAGILRDGAVLSDAELAAPSFVNAAVEDRQTQAVLIEGRRLLVERRQVGGPDLLAALAATDAQESLFPESGEAICLVDAGPAAVHTLSAARRPRRRRPMVALVAALRTLIGDVDRRLMLLGGMLASLILVSTAVFNHFYGLDPVTALYFTVTTITTTGFGDITLRNAPWGLKLYGVVLMLVGASSLAIFFALISDTLLSTRLARLLDRGTEELHGHVVVCGVGNVGFRSIQRLLEIGVTVAAAEIHEDSRFLAPVRRLQVPLMVGDAALPETLEALSVAGARCIMALTNDDVSNLQAALTARELNPGIRVVLRLGDADLARHVERMFQIGVSRSVSSLAAPPFAAAALGQHVMATVAAGGRSFVVAEGRVEPGAAAEGMTVAQIQSMLECRVLGLRSEGRVRWGRPEQPIRRGDGLLVVATRKGINDLIELVAEPGRLVPPAFPAGFD